MACRAPRTCSSHTGSQQWLPCAAVTSWLQVCSSHFGAGGWRCRGVPSCSLPQIGVHGSLLSAPGSHSASVKLWKCSEGFRKLEPLWDIPLVWRGKAWSARPGLKDCLSMASFPWATGCFRSSLPLFCLLQVGFVNSLKFSSAGDFLVAGVGQEHRYPFPSCLGVHPPPPSSTAQ